jgi:hypothetical protein
VAWPAAVGERAGYRTTLTKRPAKVQNLDERDVDFGKRILHEQGARAAADRSPLQAIDDACLLRLPVRLGDHHFRVAASPLKVA